MTAHWNKSLFIYKCDIKLNFQVLQIIKKTMNVFLLSLVYLVLSASVLNGTVSQYRAHTDRREAIVTRAPLS